MKKIRTNSIYNEDLIFGNTTKNYSMPALKKTNKKKSYKHNYKEDIVRFPSLKIEGGEYFFLFFSLLPREGKSKDIERLKKDIC